MTSAVIGCQAYESILLPLDSRSHIIPGSYFLSGTQDVQVNAINGLYPGDDNALSNPEVGYEIEGPKGYFMGIAQSDAVEIIVND